jgi:hypothetical protein
MRAEKKSRRKEMKTEVRVPCEVGKAEAETDRKTRGGVTAESLRKTRLRASAGECGHRVGLDNFDHPGSQGELR